MHLSCIHRNLTWFQIFAFRRSSNTKRNKTPHSAQGSFLLEIAASLSILNTALLKRVWLIYSKREYSIGPHLNHFALHSTQAQVLLNCLCYLLWLAGYYWFSNCISTFSVDCITLAIQCCIEMSLFSRVSSWDSFSLSAAPEICWY